MAESRALVAFACVCGDKGQGCVLDVTLPSGLLVFACDDCGAGRTLDEHASETQCHVCRKIKYFRICPRCEARVFCPGLTEKQQKKVFFHWTCPNCLADIRPARWLLGKAADFIGSLGEDHYLTSYRLLGLSATEGNADPDRRKLTGTLLAASGFSGIATGSCTILFCSTGAALDDWQHRELYCHPILGHDSVACQWPGVIHNQFWRWMDGWRLRPDRCA